MSLRTKFTISNGNRELAVLLIISTHDFEQQRLDRGVIKKSSHDKNTTAIGSLRCSKFTFMIKSNSDLIAVLLMISTHDKKNNSDWIAALSKNYSHDKKTTTIGSLRCKQQRLDRCVIQNFQPCFRKTAIWSLAWRTAIGSLPWSTAIGSLTFADM